MKRKIFFTIVFLIIATIFIISYSCKIGAGKYCCESPMVRWKFAIYTGECNDETGCHFTKIEQTGVLEYFGLKKIPCPCDKHISVKK